MTPDGAVSRIRVVVAQVGDDGHDRETEIVARALRDAGHEVVYTGPHQSPEQVVETAIAEDADLVGLTVSSGAPLRSLVGLLADRDASDIAVLGVGSVPEEDVAGLEEIGVAGIFTPGAPAHEIAGWVAQRFGEQATT